MSAVAVCGRFRTCAAVVDHYATARPTVWDRVRARLKPAPCDTCPATPYVGARVAPPEGEGTP